MNTGAKIGPGKYLVAQMVAFVGLTAISTVVAALRHLKLRRWSVK